jgi:hypothetical protein
MLHKMMTSLERFAYGCESFLEQRRATRALLKFCDDHGYNVAGVQDIRACLAALEAGERSTAVAAFKRVPIGGMGCFNDWWPPAIGPLETEEYASAVFDALVYEWHRRMTTLEKHV